MHQKNVSMANKHELKTSKTQTKRRISDDLESAIWPRTYTAEEWKEMSAEIGEYIKKQREKSQQEAMPFTEKSKSVAKAS